MTIERRAVVRNAPMSRSRRPALCSVLLASLALAACERRAASPPAEPPTARTAERSAAEPGTAREAPPVPSAPVEVEIPTEDGIVVHGTLYPGASREAPAVILVHQLGSTRAEWAPLVEALRAPPALTVLAIDLRGHGASTQGPRGDISYGAFDTDAWALTSIDVITAAFYLQNGPAPVRPSRVAAVGSSIGATAVVRAGVNVASLDPLVLLSPGRAYHGVDGILPALDLGARLVLAVSARDEVDSTETAAALARITHGRAEVVDGGAHGVALFAARETLVEELATFLREGLARAPGPAPSVPAAEGAEAPTP